MPVIIKSGQLVTAERTIKADIRIEGEKIVEIGQDLRISTDCEMVDAAGKLVMPGGVDVHTHFDLPMFGTVSSDDHYSGHKAAAFGGTTTVIDFIPHEKQKLLENVTFWKEKVKQKAAIDYSFHMNITHLDEDIENSISFLVEQGITSLKVFSAYNNRLRLRDDQILRVLRIAKKHGLLTMLHAENGDVIELLTAEALASGHTTPEYHGLTRPKWSAVEANLRGAALAAMAAAPLYFVHMNTSGEVDMLRYARQQGIQVLGETCPQYLFFTQVDLCRPDGSKWVCSPPVRGEKDQEALWSGLINEDISVLSTDHCSFFFDGRNPILYEGEEIAIPGKELGQGDFSKIPNGLPGVGDRLPVFWTASVVSGKISPNQFVAIISENPAKIFGMYPRKGTIKVGSDADLLIWNPDKQISYGVKIAQHRTDYNLYEGWELIGFPEKVFLRGKLMVDHGNWLGQPGSGKFISRAIFDPTTKL